MASAWLFVVIWLTSIAADFVNQVREYNLTLGTKWSSKDGNGRPTFTINGQTPGPLIWGYEGDTLRVRVTNNVIAEATMHWHGVYQLDKYWMDGVPGVTQWPIEPRDTYTYEFTLGNQTGSYWYHGHFNAILADGQRGPLWIRPKPSRPRPYNLISKKTEDIAAIQSAEDRAHHLMVYDWEYDTIDQLLIMYRDTGATPFCAASILVNGKGRTICLDEDTIVSAPFGKMRDSRGCLPPDVGAQFINKRDCKSTYADLEVVQAEAGESYVWINFIHPGVHHEFRISIDEHEMWIVAADGDFVQPKKVNVSTSPMFTHFQDVLRSQAINLNMAERISVLVPLAQEPKENAIRIASMSIEQLIYGLGVLRYPNVQEKRDHDGRMVLPNSKPSIDLRGELIDDGVLMDEMKLAPFPARRPPPKADHTYKFTVNRPAPDTWTLGSEAHQGFRQQMPPMLWNKESRGATSVSGIRNGSVVDLVFVNMKASMHPFHKYAPTR
ncbi:Iron transport multicopper oxidase [Elsinoe australis]|uniref:Iron transport multicopper oxidase n=1 Tax=Elsinoe australis TaxID=40998 RepID=A0A2P7Z441_9PEZI|nr:Iron transport multicopper oxidase [Elsinoe australis]